MSADHVFGAGAALAIGGSLQTRLGAIPMPDPAEANELLDGTAIVLLSFGVLVLMAFVLWLGRELMASRLSVRMLAENQRLSRREQQHQRALAKERSQHLPAPAPAAKARSGKLRRSPEPPPLPASEPPDWSDSRLRTELRTGDDLPPDERELRAAELEERVLDPESATVEFPLVAGGAKPTKVWPWRKRPKPDEPSDK